MHRLAHGHDSALNDIMERYRDRLFNFLLRELQNPAEAVDLAEETFVRVYTHRSRYDPRHKFSTWLYAIATNLVRDKYRWRSRHPEVSIEAYAGETGDGWVSNLPDSNPGPGESLDRAERAEAVRDAIAKLPEELRTPLVLSQYEGLPHAEIAEILGCSSKAVEMRVYRARQQLRDALAGLLQPS
jgi:RNA polymerase sigma-70 factor (ECF subfamily)